MKWQGEGLKNFHGTGNSSFHGFTGLWVIALTSARCLPGSADGMA
jgi:hypothetical protein